MAHESGQSGASSSTVRWKHDVFLSFYGDDTRTGFTDHLHAALKDRGINVFRDREKLKQGEEIWEELKTAIEESKYAILVISQNYANSKWCLKELTEIMECRKKETKRLTVFPVFYRVEPTHVRHQRGSFGDCFNKLEDVSEADRERWRICLKEVANLCGRPVKDDSYESEVIEGICTEIFHGLNRNLSNGAKNLVGLESRIKEMKDLLDTGCLNVRFVGISGMGGVGKTTLARVIYRSISIEFKDCCFIENVTDKSNNLISLQEILIFKLLKERMSLSDTGEGKELIQGRLSTKKVLIVLDNVDKKEQLEVLAENHDWFGPGSRILVTTRDRQILNGYADKIFEARGLDDVHAFQLFCWEAFKSPNPEKNYEELSRDIVKCAGGLPLALKIFGGHLIGKPIHLWKDARETLSKKSDILDKLEISYTGLEDGQQQLFLDVACFFNEANKNDVIYKLESLGHYNEYDISVLEDKSLIKIFGSGIQMHDLLVTLGREIVRMESPKKPGSRSRLWCCDDIVDVLKNNTGTDAVETIVLKLPLPQPRKLSFESFSNMRKLRMLVICPKTICGYEVINNKTLKDLNTVIWYGNPSKFMLSNELRILEWWRYPLKNLPTNFEPENLIEFKMPMSNIIKLSDATKNFEKLKYISLKDSPDLVEIPDLKEIPNLEELDIRGTAVTQLSSSIEIMEKFHDLHIGGNLLRPVTFLSHNLPSSLRFLKKLNLSYCNLLDVTFLNDISCSSSLEALNLTGNNFTQMASISQLWKLNTLVLNKCTGLISLPPKLQGSLQYIYVDKCPSLTPFSNPKDLLTFREMLVSGDIAVKALFFGSNGKRDEAWHVGQLSLYYRDFLIKATISWGPALTSDIPKWFNQKGTSLPDISGTFQFDFNVNVHLLLHLSCLKLEPDYDSDSEMVSDLDLLATNFYEETPLSEGERELYSLSGYTREINSCWGYALFIVYEAVEVNSCERNCSSTTFPVFVCELEVNNEDHQKVPKKCRGTSPKVPLAFRVPEIPSVGRNGIWVFLDYECFADIIWEMGWYYIGSCSITISSPSPNVEVKECGGRLVLKHDRSEFCEIVRSLSTHGSECYDVVRSISPNLVPVFSPFRNMVVLSGGNQGESVLGKRDSIAERRRARWKWGTWVQRRNYWTRESPEWKSEQQRREGIRRRIKSKRQQRKRRARKAERGVEICEEKEEEGVKTCEESEEEEGIESCEEESEEEEGVESCEQGEKEFVEIYEKGKEEGGVEICEDEKEEGIEICEAGEEEENVEICCVSYLWKSFSVLFGFKRKDEVSMNGS